MITKCGKTNTGLVRKNNEDCIYVGEQPCFILADGMGGYAGGETASRLAVSSVRNSLEQESLSSITEETLSESFREANQAILAKKAESPDLSSMGTTLLTAVVHDIACTGPMWGTAGCTCWKMVHSASLQKTILL